MLKQGDESSKEMEALRKELNELRSSNEKTAQVNLTNVVPGLESVLQSLSTLNTKLGDYGKDMVDSINAVETQVNSVSRLFAGSHQMAQLTRDTLREATPSVAALGGTAEDVGRIQKGVLEGLQTQSALNTSSYKELYAAGSLVSSSSENAGAKAAAMIPMFTNAGYGINNIGKEMTGILNSAKELGVTSQSVYKQLEGQMGKMALYNFEGGVQGMAKMAAQAALLRIDIGQSLALADKLFEPENAVQMSAAFQRLGVQVTSLLDPYKLMDMSRNDPEKLQEEVGKALKSMTYFDEQTKSIRILPGAQGQLREIAKEMGISADQVAKWAMSAGDLDRKMREIKFNPDFADEKSQKMIAGMAQLQTEGDFKGLYTVKYQDEKGETKEKIVSEINSEDLKQIQETNKKLESPAQMQLEANGILKNIEGLIAARRGVVGRAIATDPGFAKNLKELGKIIATGQETVNQFVGLQRDAIDDNKINVESISKNVNAFISVIGKSFDKLSKGDIAGAGGEILKGGSAAFEQIKETVGNTGVYLDKASKRYGTENTIEVKSIQDLLKTLGFEIEIKAIQPTQTAVPTPQSSSAGSGQLPNKDISMTSSGSSNVSVDGTITIKVDPSSLDGLAMNMLSDSKISNALYTVIERRGIEINDLTGSGENKARAGNLFSPTSAAAGIPG